MVVVFGRCVIGAALLLPWTIARGQLRPALRHWRALLLFAVLEMAAPWFLLTFAEQSLSSSLTGLLVATVPFMAALAGRLLGEEDRLTPVRLLGMGVGVVGIVVLLGLDIGRISVLPLVAVAVVVVGYATGPLVVTRALSEVSGVAASAVALTFTGLGYAAFAVPKLHLFATVSSRAVLSVITLGAVCTALALALFFQLIREVGPQRALVITFVNPAVAVLLGVVLLGEPFTLGLALGLPIVLAGCVLATRRSAERSVVVAEPRIEAPLP